MNAILDRARDFWARISPRERKIVMLAAIAAPLTIALWLSMSIHDGLTDREDRNQHTRKALHAVEDLAARGAPAAPTDDIVSKLPFEPIKLETYLDKAAQKAQTQLKGDVTPRPARRDNGFRTDTVSCQLDDVTLEQLKSFLFEVENGSKAVMVTRLELRRDFKAKEKIDATLEVSTYSREKDAAAATGSGSAGSGGGSADSGSAGSGKKAN